MPTRPCSKTGLSVRIARHAGVKRNAATETVDPNIIEKEDYHVQQQK